MIRGNHANYLLTSTSIVAIKQAYFSQAIAADKIVLGYVNQLLRGLSQRRTSDRLVKRDHTSAMVQPGNDDVL